MSLSIKKNILPKVMQKYYDRALNYFEKERIKTVDFSERTYQYKLLDVETEKALWERIFQDEKAGDTAFLVVSHRKEALRRADHIIVLKDGAVDGEGSLEALLASNDEMQAIWEGNIELVGNP